MYNFKELAKEHLNAIGFGLQKIYWFRDKNWFAMYAGKITSNIKSTRKSDKLIYWNKGIRVFVVSTHSIVR